MFFILIEMYTCFLSQVEEGGKVTLTGGEITVTDPDTVVDSLIIVVDKKPSFGDMIDSAPGNY